MVSGMNVGVDEEQYRTDDFFVDGMHNVFGITLNKIHFR